MTWIIFQENGKYTEDQGTVKQCGLEMFQVIQKNSYKKFRILKFSSEFFFELLPLSGQLRVAFSDSYSSSGIIHHSTLVQYDKYIFCLFMSPIHRRGSSDFNQVGWNGTTVLLPRYYRATTALLSHYQSSFQIRYVLFDLKLFHFYRKPRSGDDTIQKFLVDFRSKSKPKQDISQSIVILFL